MFHPSGNIREVDKGTTLQDIKDGRMGLKGVGIESLSPSLEQELSCDRYVRGCRAEGTASDPCEGNQGR